MIEHPFHLASFGRRFAAGTIDLVIVLLIFELAVAFIPSFRDWIELASTDPQRLGDLTFWETLLIFAAYMILLGPIGGGATPGYRLMRLRLVNLKTGEKPGWLRVLLWCIGSILIPIGWVRYWFDDTRQMLHNHVSRTIVIDTSPDKQI